MTSLYQKFLPFSPRGVLLLFLYSAAPSADSSRGGRGAQLPEIPSARARRAVRSGSFRKGEVVPDDIAVVVHGTEQSTDEALGEQARAQPVPVVFLDVDGVLNDDSGGTNCGAEEAGTTPFWSSQGKFHAVVLQSVGNISDTLEIPSRTKTCRLGTQRHQENF